jgi:hypothetical protein
LRENENQEENCGAGVEPDLLMAGVLGAGMREGYPTIVDLQFGPEGDLYVLTIQALYRIKVVEA